MREVLQSQLAEGITGRILTDPKRSQQRWRHGEGVVTVTDGLDAHYTEYRSWDPPTFSVAVWVRVSLDLRATLPF